ncbi:hypothetical protein [Terrihabitans sp. B22-R8]
MRPHVLYLGIPGRLLQPSGNGEGSPRDGHVFSKVVAHHAGL